MRSDGQRDTQKLTVAFCTFAKVHDDEQMLCRVAVGNSLGTNMCRIIDNTSNAQYVGSNACEYEYTRSTRANII